MARPPHVSWRLLQQLNVIDQQPSPGITVSQLARRSGQTMRTIHFYTQELHQRGLIERDQNGKRYYYTSTLIGLRAAQSFRRLCDDLGEPSLVAER